MTRRRRPSAKVCKKKHMGCCFFCGKGYYEVLHAHRILPGEEGGKYHWANILPCCPFCHTEIHLGRIVVHGRHPSTGPSHYVHYTKDGVENWESEDRWKHN